MAKYIPSPRDWAREQVALYESSGGTKGTTLRARLWAAAVAAFPPVFIAEPAR